MKKLISVLLVMILAFTVISCSDNTDTSSGSNFRPDTNITASKTEEKCEDYIYYLTLVLEYEWDKSIDSKMYNENNAMYFKSALQKLYKYDYGKEIHNADGYVVIDDYIDICKKHFPVDDEAVKQLLKNSGVYDEATNSVTMTEGIGSIKLAVIDDIVIDGNVVEISYSVGDEMYDENTKTYIPSNSIKGTLIVEVKDNNYVFVSNKHIAYPSAESKPHPYPQEYEAEKLTECLVYSMDKTAFEENRAEFNHATLLIRLSCVDNESFRYTPMLPLNSRYNKEFSVPVCENIIYDILGEEIDVHSFFPDDAYDSERDLYEFSTDFGSGGNYKGENFQFTVAHSGLNCSVSFDLYEEQAVNGEPAWVKIGRYRFDYKLLIDKNCWQFAGFEKL